MKLKQLPTTHLDCGHSLWLSDPLLVHSHEVVCHPFLLRSSTQKESFGHQCTYPLLLPVHGLFLSSLDLASTPCLRHLQNHLLSLHGPYFARLFFTLSLPFPWFLYYHLAPDSLQLILSLGCIIPNLSQIPLILYHLPLVSLCFLKYCSWVPFQFPSSGLHGRLEVVRDQ